MKDKTVNFLRGLFLFAVNKNPYVMVKVKAEEF